MVEVTVPSLERALLSTHSGYFQLHFDIEDNFNKAARFDCLLKLLTVAGTTIASKALNFNIQSCLSCQWRRIFWIYPGINYTSAMYF